LNTRKDAGRTVAKEEELSPAVLNIFDLVTERHTYFSSNSVNLFGRSWTRTRTSGSFVEVPVH
jgi:hypothetical protein